MIAKENRLCIYTVKKILEVGKKNIPMEDLVTI